MYAKTIVQLYNQLRSLFSEEEVLQIYRVYWQILPFFSGMYHRNGDTFINHLIGVASIVASLRLPFDLVIAGLTHSIYTHGIFPMFGGTLAPAKREEIRRIVGPDVEELLVRYSEFEWTEQSACRIHHELNKIDSIGQKVVLLRLVNELDDYLDLGILFCSSAESRCRSMKRLAPHFIEMAEQLGFPELGEEFTRVFYETERKEIPLLLRYNRRSAFYILPSKVSLPSIFGHAGSIFMQVWKLLKPRKRLSQLTRKLQVVRRR